MQRCLSNSEKWTVVCLALLALAVAGCTTNSHGETEKSSHVISQAVKKAPGDPAHNTAEHETAMGHSETAHTSHVEGEHHDHENVVKLSPAEIQEFGIKLEKAGPGRLGATISLTGEVVLNPDKVVHVLPRVPGIAREVFKSVGDAVKAGEPLAILDSAQLAASKSAYLEALTKEELQRTNFAREQKLWNEKISSERDYLTAKQALKEAAIHREKAERALHTLGLSEADLARLPDQQHKDLTRYVMSSPLDGIVVKRHLVRGEVVREDNDEPPFVVADMSSVWVNFTIYQKDLVTVKKGQGIRIVFGKGVPDALGVIDYVSPVLDESTRTATARVVLPNEEGHWRPGAFVTGYARLGDEPVKVLVPKTAVLTLDGQSVIFVKTDKGFEPRQVVTGKEDRHQVEIAKGLKPGETYVAEKGFTLKAELKKSTFAGEGHGH